MRCILRLCLTDLVGKWPCVTLCRSASVLEFGPSKGLLAAWRDQAAEPEDSPAVRPRRAEGQPGAGLRCRLGSLGPWETIHGRWTGSEKKISNVIKMNQCCVCVFFSYLKIKFLKYSSAPVWLVKQLWNCKTHFTHTAIVGCFFFFFLCAVLDANTCH